MFGPRGAKFLASPFHVNSVPRSAPFRPSPVTCSYLENGRYRLTIEDTRGRVGQGWVARIVPSWLGIIPDWPYEVSFPMSCYLKNNIRMTVSSLLYLDPQSVCQQELCDWCIRKELSILLFSTNYSHSLREETICQFETSNPTSFS